MEIPNCFLRGSCLLLARVGRKAGHLPLDQQPWFRCGQQCQWWVLLLLLPKLWVLLPLPLLTKLRPSSGRCRSCSRVVLFWPTHHCLNYSMWLVRRRRSSLFAERGTTRTTEKTSPIQERRRRRGHRENCPLNTHQFCKRGVTHI